MTAFTRIKHRITPAISLNYMAFVLGCLSELDIDIEQVIHDSTLDPQLFSSLNALHTQPMLDQGTPGAQSANNIARHYLSVYELTALYESILDNSHLAAEQLGLIIGSKANFNAYDFFGTAAISCASFRDTLIILCRYFGLLAPIYQATYKEHNEGASISFLGNNRLPIPVATLCLYSMLSSLLVMMESILHPDDNHGPTHTIDTYLPFENNESFSFVRNNLTIRVHFNASQLRIELPNTLLSKPLPFANPHAARTAIAECDSALSLLNDQSNVMTMVKQELHKEEGVFPSIEKIANRFHMSTRTLHRMLSANNITYKQLVLEARMNQAAHLLQDNSISITDIAYRTGYNDAANFTRTFKKYFQQKPKEFRAKQKGLSCSDCPVYQWAIVTLPSSWAFTHFSLPIGSAI